MQFASTPTYGPGLHSNGDTREALSPAETLQAAWLQCRSGVSDACRWKTVYQLIQEDPRVKSNVLKSTLLQVVLLASVIALDFIIAPKLAKKGLQAGDRVQFFYQVFWLWPLFGLSFFFAGQSNSRVSQSQDGRLQAERHISSEQSLGSKAVDGLARTGVIVQCFVVSYLLYRIPYIGWLLSFVFFCIIDAYWCFESVWRTSKSMSFQERAKFLEERWPYFLGFGFPCTLISFFHSSPLVNLSLFSLVFPIMLLLASIAKPLPTPDSSSDLLPAESKRVTTGWKYFPRRAPVLYIAVKASELIQNPSIRRLLSQSEKKSSTPTYPSQSMQSTRWPQQQRSYQQTFSPYTAQNSRPYKAPSALADQGGQAVNSNIAMRPGFNSTPSGGLQGRRRVGDRNE